MKKLIVEILQDNNWRNLKVILLRTFLFLILSVAQLALYRILGSEELSLDRLVVVITALVVEYLLYRGQDMIRMAFGYFHLYGGFDNLLTKTFINNVELTELTSDTEKTNRIRNNLNNATDDIVSYLLLDVPRLVVGLIVPMLFILSESLIYSIVAFITVIAGIIVFMKVNTIIAPMITEEHLQKQGSRKKAGDAMNSSWLILNGYPDVPVNILTRLRQDAINTSAKIWTKIMAYYFLTDAIVTIGVIVLIIGMYLTNEPNNLRIYLYFMSAVGGAHSIGKTIRTLMRNAPMYDSFKEIINPNREGDKGEIVSSITSITIEGGGFAYPGKDQKKVYKNLSLSLTRGYIYVLSEPSGSGKTTLFKLLMKIHLLTTGTYLVNNKPVTDFSGLSFRRRISYMEQEGKLPASTVFDCMKLLNIEYDQEEVAKLLSEFHLSDIDVHKEYGSNCFKLSPGQRKRICFILHLLQHKDRDVFIFDEPTNHVEEEIVKIMMRQIEELADENKIVLIATHKDMGLLPRTSQKITL